MAGPLEGIKVMDVSQLAVGPWAGTLLGQLGAEVFKVEEPKGDPIKNLLPWMNGVGTYYTAVNLSKRDIALDLKRPEDLQIALQLAERVDVFLENFRPGVTDRLGLGYEALRKINPRLVYCSSSGYGSRGPRRLEGSGDPTARSSTGFDSFTGPEGGRAERFRNLGHIDHTSSTFIVEAILAALYAREKYGVGQKVETSMMQATMAYQTSRAAEYFATGVSPIPMGSAVPNLVPHQAFRTMDNFIAVGVNTEQEWMRLCEALGMPGLAKDPRFKNNASRVTNREAIVGVLEREFARKTTQEWLALLEREDVPCGPFLTFKDLWEHSQVQANAMIVEVEHPWGKVKVGGTPWKFSQTPATILPAPALDQHREEIIQFLKEHRPAGKGGGAPVKELGSPLQGIVVVELAQGIAAPFAAMQLGDLGAEVIKIELPEGDWTRHAGPPFLDGESALFLALNRDKKGVVLDITSAEGWETLRRLLSRADVLITDLRPREAEALKLTLADCKKLNPMLVYSSVTPFGEEGPLKNRTGGEVVLQAMSDVWRYLGEQGKPPLRLGPDVAAMAAGIFAVQGTIAALLCRERQGIAQKVAVSHFGAMLALETHLNAAQSNSSLSGGWHLPAPMQSPEYLSQTKDFPVEINLGGRGQSGGWEEFCKALGVPDEIRKDPRFSEGLNRTINRGALALLLEPFLVQKTAAELKAVVEELGGRVVVGNNYETLFRDPQVAAMGMLQELEHPTLGEIKTLGLPWNFEATPASINMPPPTLGQHTSEARAMSQ